MWLQKVNLPPNRRVDLLADSGKPEARTTGGNERRLAVADDEDDKAEVAGMGAKCCATTMSSPNRRTGDMAGGRGRTSHVGPTWMEKKKKKENHEIVKKKSGNPSNQRNSHS